MAFKTVQTQKKIYADPESLFNDIKQKKVNGLLAIQADIIREYTKNHDQPDIAIQLSTGVGKTLIGILISEWLRQKHNAKVLYLCPTIQLVQQVSEQALGKYGINHCVFTGSKHDYSNQIMQEYNSCEKIGITTYSSLFNSNSFFTDPEYIILDDVHQADTYIQSLWTVQICKSNQQHSVAYERLFNVLHEYLQTDIYKLSSADLKYNDKLPATFLFLNKEKIILSLDDSLQDTDQFFSWSMIRNYLHACHFYYSAQEFMIKPLYPPTFSFKPFENAQQRIYMSATLGEGGDLERITGRKNIFQLSIPDEWKHKTVGRRFFCFPALSCEPEINDLLLCEAIKKVNRCVYITSSNQNLEKIKGFFQKNLHDYNLFGVKDIECKKNSFISSDKAILLLANRYDGIDFPDDDARMLIIDSFPKAQNLQEHFLIERLGHSVLFTARIITKLIQAFGRTTRGSTDYSVVIVRNDKILDYIHKKSYRSYLYPELNAEIEFGLQQAKQIDQSDFLENIQIFLNQSEEWKKIDTNILASRDNYKKLSLPNSNILLSIVKHEIQYNQNLWQENFSDALRSCKEILALLISSEDLRCLRGYWNYMAGYMSFILEGQNIKPAISSKTYFEEAAKAAPSLTWLHKLKQRHQIDIDSCFDENTLSLVDRIEDYFERIGLRNLGKLNSTTQEILRKLETDDSRSFEIGQKELGTLLGFDADKEERDGSPDPWWLVNEKICFVFEDYTEGQEDTSLSIRKAREATSHRNWITDNVANTSDAAIYVFLVGKIRQAQQGAIPHLHTVAFWNTNEFRIWAKNAVVIIKDLYNSYPGKGDMIWRDQAIEKLENNDIAPKCLIKKFEKNIASDTLTIKAKEPSKET